MREILTSGSMSGDGKRSVAEWPKLPRPSSTLPFLPFMALQHHGSYRVYRRHVADRAGRPSLRPTFLPTQVERGVYQTDVTVRLRKITQHAAG